MADKQIYHHRATALINYTITLCKSIDKATPNNISCGIELHSYHNMKQIYHYYISTVHNDYKNMSNVYNCNQLLQLFTVVCTARRGAKVTKPCLYTALKIFCLFIQHPNTLTMENHMETARHKQLLF